MSREHRVRVADIDPKLFWGAIVARQDVTEQSFREVGRQLGLVPATFTRLRYAAWDIQPDYRPDLRTYMSLCWWLGRNPDDFVVWPDDRSRPEDEEAQSG